MKPTSLLPAIFLLALLPSCTPETPLADAYGNFEAREVVVSSEVTGKLLEFRVEEGETLDSGLQVGLIDTVPYHLRRLQLLASLQALPQKKINADPQIDIYVQQRNNLLREIKRGEALAQSNAITPKQLDDLRGQLDVVNQQIASAKAQETISNRGILAELAPLEAQLKQVEDQISRCYLFNPIQGTVLQKMTESSEMAIAGKALYKIADLKTMTLRAYFSGDQLPHIKIGQTVKVLIDESKESNRELPGVITWISDQAEFTPKIVQTKEERVNLVYAVKIQVQNDGAVKIGMPAEVNL
ncbi:MAG: HlyD family efflux transporter periplasmic adaptor subunit [Haliscomenobacter sp.]|nr:HlyD family efflux transporter periplasmic adaptor subunit [Haliscomenobacter sp.]MBP9078436.1 HlyD family efflux transporter periplasmic adaptor subunit [Haliscomenobacter sp.]MBP9875140.1 HlyD family efflux transporter periplasmic adaptor subunit [Haliscomenobacter sp.]